MAAASPSTSDAAERLARLVQRLRRLVRGELILAGGHARLKQQRNQTVDAGAYWQPDQATYAKAIVYRSRVRDRLTTIGDCTGAASLY